MSNDVEVWKPVVNYDGFYYVPSFGRLRSDKSFNKYMSGKLISGGVNNLGYVVYILCKDGKKKCHHLHRMVARAFLGDSNLAVNHKDGNKHNNRIDNLEYVTDQENMNHAVKNRLHAYGEKIWCAKLNDVVVSEIRNKYKLGGISHRQLGHEYNISKTAIGQAIRGKTWRHIVCV